MKTDDKLFLNDMNQKCELLQNLLGYDIEYIDESNAPVLSLIKHEFPEDMQNLKPAIHTTINEQLINSSYDNYFFYTSPFHLAYIAVSIWCGTEYKGVLIVGPFLNNIPNNSFVQEIINKYNIPITKRIYIQEFYRSLTVIDYNYHKNLGNLIVNIFANKFTSGRRVISDNTKSVFEDYNTEKCKEPESFIQLRYNIEKELLHAIEKGDKEEAIKIWGRFQFNAAYRVPSNPLRAYKNLSFSANTMFRISIERSGVHPIYIHNISDKFAILIEKATTITSLQNLELVMIAEYCNAVTTLASDGYSPIVQKAINYINFNFDSQISLRSISKCIFVNPSYLSKKFKLETEMTITEFINIKRVNEAKFLIEQTNISITNIAHKVGFNNHNYFSTVFKKITSFTPSEYQNSFKKA
ncbi:MAG: helix-turn-helix transcriptional regulator [Clostridiales bacterium]|nr:helix-turn-helix transcriptional regulator [Clostridiales bacterium]